MKCPKCGYVSFDHNQTCPKCKKDISEERNKLNLPDFEPAVPFLLGALTGEADEAGMDIDIAAPEGPAVAPAGEALGVEEVASLDEDLEISLEDDWTAQEVEEESVVSDDFSELETAEGLDEAEAEEGVDDLSLELEDEEDEISLDLDELSLDEDELTEDVVFEDTSPTEEEQEPEIELESIALDEEEGRHSEEEAALEEPEEEVVLNLDDLKVNETGELEIGSPQMDAALEASGAEETIGLDGVELEEPEGVEKPADTGAEAGEPEDFTMNLDDLSLEEESEPSREDEEGELSLDLDDLELDLDLEDDESKESS